MQTQRLIPAKPVILIREMSGGRNLFFAPIAEMKHQ